jgi:hypothetical protein
MRVRTTRPTLWNDHGKGEHAIPIHTPCRVVKPSKHEKRQLEKDAKRGLKFVVVRLKGKRRYMKPADLERVS